MENRVFLVRIADPRTSVRNRRVGLGTTSAKPLGLLMNSVLEIRIARPRTFVGMLLKRIKQIHLQSACHFTRRNLQLLLAGQA